MDDSTFLRYIVKDTRYRNLSLHDLMVTRKHMIEMNAPDYDKALVQYWIMVRRGEYPDPCKSP